MKKDIQNLTFNELKEEITSFGEPVHRAKQIYKWLFQKNADSFKEMTDIPKKFIEKLNKTYFIGALECAKHLISKDGTEKFLWRLKDGEHIETVLIKEKNRKTLCLSTQVGCKFKCPFCASGIKRFVRNLTVSEIVGQILKVQRICGERITNIVFMGMGEPLDNYDNLIKAIEAINHSEGIGIGARKITVSTCGIIPGIRKLKNLGLQIELSISLHAANNRSRNELVPVNKKYPIEELIKTCEQYFKETGRIITLEYTLIKGKNDLVKDAEDLAKVAKKINAKVNLIKCSVFPGLECEAVSAESIQLFKNILRSRGVAVTVRKSKGEDILAACGQLAAEHRF